MSGFGGMVSVELEGGRRAALRFLKGLTVFTLAESLGGVESLGDHPATMTHASVPRREREAHGVTDGLVRLSCGIEDPADLAEDVLHALKGMLTVRRFTVYDTRSHAVRGFAPIFPPAGGALRLRHDALRSRPCRTRAHDDVL